MVRFVLSIGLPDRRAARSFWPLWAEAASVAKRDYPSTGQHMAKHERCAPLSAVTPGSESTEATEQSSCEIIEMASAELELLARAFNLIAEACSDGADTPPPPVIH